MSNVRIRVDEIMFVKICLPCLTLLALAANLLAAPQQANSARTDPARTDGLDATVTEIDRSSLPKPPSAIADLIQQGRVRLITGRQPESSQPGSSPARRLAGQTEFKYHFRYDSRARWTLSNRSSGPGSSSNQATVRIRVRFRSVKLEVKHDVWLRRPPQADAFWKDSIVLHEFDHVRISSDPRIENYFLDQVKQLAQISVPLSQVANRSGRVEAKKVQALIDTRMHSILDDTTDFVRIRYRELDRLTMHGMRPLPENSDLFRRAIQEQAD